MARSANLGFQLACILAPDDYKYGRRLGYFLRLEQFLTVGCDSIKFDRICVRGFHLCDYGVTLWRRPNTIKANVILGALVSAVAHLVIQPAPKFIDKVLKYQTAFRESGSQA